MSIINNEELNTLKIEIVELNGKLKTAVDAQSQAAELGLELLKQRSDLEHQLEHLQKEFDLNKLELAKTKKQLNKIKEQHKMAADNELDHEKNLLEDSAKLEAEYGTKISILETEVHNLQEQLIAYKNEVERLQTNYSVNEERLIALESERRQLRDELKDLRSREQVLQSDNNDLEEENVTLQKQVSNLKSTQVEFEAMKMEISRLIEETVLLQAEAEEANKLRSLAEKQEQEALAGAQAEREQRLYFKREYEKLHNDQHLSTLNHLIFGIDNNNTEDSQSNTLKQLESSIISDSPFKLISFKSSANVGQNLFSEIHDGLNERVAELELEKEELKKKLLVLKKTILNIVSPLFQKLSVEIKEDCEVNTQLKDIVELAIARFDELFLNIKKEKSKDLLFDQKEFDQLKLGFRQAILLGGLKNAKLTAAYNRIIGLSQTLYQFYAEIAGGDESIENRRKVSEIIQQLRLIAKANNKNVSTSFEKQSTNLFQNDQTSTNQKINNEFDQDAYIPTSDCDQLIISLSYKNELTSKIEKADENFLNQILMESDLKEKLVYADLDDLQKITSLLQELVRLVKLAAETTVQSRLAMEDKDKADLYQANTKLKSLLAVKREQVSSLRAVLRSNKTSTESALQCVRDKYESEKRLKDEAMESLRKELKQFKEDAATFASHRAMFNARYEELQGQLESKQQSLKATDDEKRTLNQLLRMAIHQKIELTQRVEEMEMERERQTQNWSGNSKRLNSKQSGLGIGGNRRHGGEMTRTVRYPQNSQNANNTSGTGNNTSGSWSAR